MGDINWLHIYLGTLIIAISIFMLYREKYISALCERNRILQNKLDRLSNKIADLPPVELDTFLEGIMLMQLQIESAANSTLADPNVKEDLYARGIVAFMNYLGTTTDAIEARYGKGYLTHWYDARYKLMDMSGQITKMINNPPYSVAYQEMDRAAQAVELLKRLEKKKSQR